jgi:hypothetical protein
MFYNARWYDPYLNQFTQPDSIVPDQYNSLDWNRYAYTRYNPIKYSDPSGHCSVHQGTFDGTLDCTAKDINKATIKQRLGWFKGLIATTGRAEWFGNIVGILQAFIDEGIGDTNSWVSWVDAGILVSIQNGWSLFKYDQTSENAADMAWRDFFAATDEDDMKEKWGAAENLGTQYGLSLANEHGAVMNEREALFLKWGNELYRDLIASGQIEEFYGQLAADIGALYCDPNYHDFCNGWVNGWRNAGESLGAWFGDPRSTVPGTGKALVYFIAIFVLEK